MLEELTVKGFGIIEEVTWRPATGLNVITGETGAGKSLVVDAVEALLTGQVQEEDIRHGTDEARIEGIFCIPDQGERVLQGLLAEKGLEAGDDILLLTCDFRRLGRTTPRVNRQAVSRSVLREIGAALVDIHGQSDHLSLLNKDRHPDFLDAYACILGLRQDFGVMASDLYRIEAEIQRLIQNEQDVVRQKELLNFQIEEIRRAELQPGEEDELQHKLVLLASAEKLKAASYEVYRALYDDDNVTSSSSALDRINESLPVLKNMAETDPSLLSQFGSLQETLYGIEELARGIRSYGDNLDFDPRDLEEVQNRLELIRSLKRKYGGSIEQVLDYLKNTESEIEELTSSGERREQLETEREQLKIRMGEMASRLSQCRQEAALKLAIAVKKELGDLNMSQVDFSVAVTQESSPDGIPFPDGTLYQFNTNGVDDIVFMASTNPGEPLKPLEKIASTGEISRFLLALKGALVEADIVPVLIFDEIDIGVGGRSGEVIGRKLWKLSRNHQVICVTHLPQIAAFANAHFNVSKQTAGERTVSTIQSVQGETRCNEMAVMIGGPRYTKSSIDAAAELIRKAEAWKSGSVG